MRMSLEVDLTDADSIATRELKGYCSSVQQWPLFVHDLQMAFLHWQNTHFPSDLGYYTLSEAVHRIHLITYNADFELLSSFPVEYKLAILAPFWFPIIIPVFHGVISEIKRYRSHKK